MGIGSLSGATLDSAIPYLENDPTPSEAVKRIIYHVGTKNISIDSTEEIKAKLDTLKNTTTEKYPSATVGFCEIPTNHQMPSPKVAEINDYIKSMDATFLDVDARDPGFFTRDGLHYNKRGLGRLAATIKKWARENGHTHEATPGNHKQRRYQETEPIKNGRNVPWRKTDLSQQLLNLLLASLGKR